MRIGTYNAVNKVYGTNSTKKTNTTKKNHTETSKLSTVSVVVTSIVQAFFTAYYLLIWIARELWLMVMHVVLVRIQFLAICHLWTKMKLIILSQTTMTRVVTRAK